MILRLINKIIKYFLFFIIFFETILSQTLNQKNNPNNSDLKNSVSLQLKWKHQFQFAGYYAAMFKGFYADEGLDVSILEGNRQQDPVKNVLSGKVDFGVSDVDVLYSRMQGNPLVIVAAIFQHSHHILLTKKSSGITKPSDLIGKKVMISDYIGVAQLKSIFVKEGIPINSIKIISDKWSFDALVKDSVDMITGYITDHPYRLQKLGIEPYIIHSENYGIDFYGDLLFTSEEKADKDPELVKKFRRATIKGWEYAITHTDEVIDYILKNTDVSKRGITRERLAYEAEYVKKIVLYGYVDIGHINPGRLESMANLISSTGLIKGNYSLDGFIFDPDAKSEKKLFGYIGIAAVILLFLSGLALFIIYQLRKMVKNKTKDLVDEIQQRKVFEETLRQREARYKSLFEYSPLCILEQDYSDIKIYLDELKSSIKDDFAEYLRNNPDIILECEKKIIYVDINYEAGKYFGVNNKEEYIRKNKQYFELSSPEPFINHLISIANNETVFESEISFILNNGEEKIMILRSSIASGSEKNYKKVLISLVDITERTKIEKALFSSEKKYKKLYLEFQSILDAVPDAIIVLDPDHKIRWMNYYAKNIHGKEINMDGEKYCCKTLYGQELSCGNCTISESKTQKISKNREFTTNDGKIWELRSIPILGDQSEIISIIILIRDTTVKKKAENEMLRKEKIESVGILAGGIAHDFNNLLTAILGNISLSKLMIGKGKDEKIEKYLGTAEKATMRAKDLTYQLLTFSKGGAPIKKKTTLNDIIKDSANFVLRGSKNKLGSDIPGDLWTVEIDEGQISQVVQNLVINADQSMQNPGVILITCKNLTVETGEINNLEGGNYVRVSIKDHGTGIPEELKSKIFDPYFTTKSQGNGLGLATSYSIIKKHQGSLTVESEVGAGSEFSFFLPAVKNTGSISELENHEIIAGKGKVLVIDDEIMVRELLSDILMSLGYEVTSVSEGSTAIQEFSKAMDTHPFDVVITDLTIPGGLGGKELFDELVKINKNIKVIISSGYSNDPLMAEYKKHGFKAVISKPYVVEELSKTVASVLGS